MTEGKSLIRTTAALGALAVILGASGAHGRMHDLLVANDSVEIWGKAVFYHFIHVAVMFALALSNSDRRTGPWTCFLAGIMIFSGSLYLLAATKARWMGGITPIGGLSFVAGWLWLAIRPPAQKVQGADRPPSG